MTITLDGNNQITTGVINSATAKNATGTAVDFTGIPAGIKRITVMFAGVSTNGTSSIQCQIGTSGGIQTSSYFSNAATLVNASGTGVTQFSTGFGVNPNMAATEVLSGAFRITLLDASTGLWTCEGTLARTEATIVFCNAGSKTLSGTLDRIRITTVNGTDTFDAGSINILYE